MFKFKNIVTSATSKITDAANKLSDPSGSIRTATKQVGNVISTVGNAVMNDVRNYRTLREGLPPDAYYYLYKLLTPEQLKNMPYLEDRIRFVQKAKKEEEEQAFKTRMIEMKKMEDEISKKMEEKRNKEQLRKEMLIKEKEEKKRKAEEAYNKTPKGQVEMLEKTIREKDALCHGSLHGFHRYAGSEDFMEQESKRCRDEYNEGMKRLAKCKLNLRDYEESIQNNNPIPFTCGGSKTRRRRHSKNTATRKSRRHHTKSKKTRRH